MTPDAERIHFLIRVAVKETRLLNETTGRLFLEGQPVTEAQVRQWISDTDKAERFGWIESAEDWQTYRKLRNQMVHEYSEDPRVLADALEAGRSFVEPLSRMGEILVAEAKNRSHS